jgi:hypothetical protein
MGWLISFGDTKKETIARRVATMGAGEDKRHRTLKHCVRGNCLWKVVAIEESRDGEWVEVDRYIGLDLLAKGCRPDEGWGYKDLCESMGPVELSCPISYLDMVPCPDSEYARNWRTRVREKAAGKQAVTEVIRAMKVGDTLYLKKGCKPEAIILSSKRPLRGHVGGMGYKIPRRLVDATRTRLHLSA